MMITDDLVSETMKIIIVGNLSSITRVKKILRYIEDFFTRRFVIS